MQRIRSCLCLCLVAAAASAADVPTIPCPAEAPRVRTLELVERWRVGGDPEDPLIGVVVAARSDTPGGDLYFLDRQLKQILVYGDDGELLDILGREGDGPGEFRRPNGLRVVDELLVVKDGWPSRLVFLDRDGLPAGQWRPEGNWAVVNFRRVPGGWLAGGLLQKENDATSWYYDEAIARFDEEGRRVHDYRLIETERVFQPHTVDERGPYLAHSGWDLTTGGELVISCERDAYRLEYLDLDGRLLRVVERELPPYRRTDEDKQEIRENSRLFINGERQETIFHLLDTEPVISWLRARADGSIMVGTCWAERELSEGVFLRFDVHSPDGSLREEVHLTGEVDLTYDSVRLLGDGRAVILRNFRSATRNMHGTGEEGDPVRDGDDLFEIVVCDLVEARPN